MINEFAPLLAMAALVFSLINFLRFLSGKDYKSAVTQLTVWVGGVVVAFLVAQTDFASGISVGDLPLDQLNGWSLLFVGLSIGSTGSVVNELRGAIDNSDSTRKPSLVK